MYFLRSTLCRTTLILPSVLGFVNTFFKLFYFIFLCFLPLQKGIKKLVIFPSASHIFLLKYITNPSFLFAFLLVYLVHSYIIIFLLLCQYFFSTFFEIFFRYFFETFYRLFLGRNVYNRITFFAKFLPKSPVPFVTFYYLFLCLTASYITIPADTDAFSDVTLPFIGIFTRKSQFFLTSSLIPNPSLPMTMAIGPFKSCL